MPKYNEPPPNASPAYRLVQRRDGSFNVLARDRRGVTYIRPIRAEPSPAYHRLLRILKWLPEIVSVGLVEDQRLLDALGDFEHALIEYLDTRP